MRVRILGMALAGLCLCALTSARASNDPLIGYWEAHIDGQSAVRTLRVTGKDMGGEYIANWQLKGGGRHSVGTGTISNNLIKFTFQIFALNRDFTLEVHPDGAEKMSGVTRTRGTDHKVELMKISPDWRYTANKGMGCDVLSTGGARFGNASRGVQHLADGGTIPYANTGNEIYCVGGELAVATQ